MVIVLGVVAILCCVSSATASGVPKQVGYPSSIAAIGDSWETGYATNPTGGGDVEANNWVTGTNSVVDSFYERILAVNPKIKGRVRNVAGDGATSGEFTFQAGMLTGTHVDLIVEALGGNDLCGAEPLKPQFGIDMGKGMRQLALEHPDARILIVGIGMSGRSGGGWSDRTDSWRCEHRRLRPQVRRRRKAVACTIRVAQAT